MFVFHKEFKASSLQSSTEDSDLGSLSDIEPKAKPFSPDHGFIPRAGGLMRDLVNSLSLAKSQSICTFSDKPGSTRGYKTEVSDLMKRMMRPGSSNETDSECEPEPQGKLNSLVSVMVSTIMCLAANCPIPRSNIQATKLFLSTVVDENGESPRNIKALLNILKNYRGPYLGESPKVTKFGRSSSAAETVIKTSEVVLEPTVSPSRQPLDRVRASRTRSRLPSLSPVKRSIEPKKRSSNA